MDRLIVYILMGVLAVLSIVTITGNRDAAEAAKNAEIAANKAEEAAGFATILRDCQTPGTECYKYRAQNDQALREYFDRLTRGANICTLVVSGQVNSGVLPFEEAAMERVFNECVSARAGAIPNTAGATDE